MSNFLRVPKNQLALTLFLIFITGLITNYSFSKLALFFVSILSCIFFDFVFLRIRKNPLFFPSAAIVTGLLITLISDPNFSWYQIVIICAVTIASKNFIRPLGRHVFNPTAFGLIASSVFFGNAISWWGVSWQQFNIYGIKFIFFLILLSPSLVSQFRMQRFRITISFLITYVLVNQILNSRFLILDSLLDPTVLFFSIVMLPEPMTSPNNHMRQVLFGIFVAIISIVVSLPFLNSHFDPLLLSLLIANLIFFKLR